MVRVRGRTYHCYLALFKPSCLHYLRTVVHVEGITIVATGHHYETAVAHQRQGFSYSVITHVLARVKLPGLAIPHIFAAALPYS